MYKNFIAIIALSFPLLSLAQSEPTDSLATDSISLGEVTVTAAPVVHKADRDVYVPNQQVKERSANGLNLLENLQIPSIFVDNVMDKVNAGGNDVQFRINGREATLRDVKALQPSSIVRVEYLDNPGLRYKGATNVLNFVVRNPTVGGSFMVNALSTLSNEKLANGFVNLKLNNGPSQWGFDMFAQNNSLAYAQHSTEQYLLPTQSITRQNHTIDGHTGNAWIWGNVYYNYLIPDKTNIYVQAQIGTSPHDKTNYHQLMTETDESRATQSLETFLYQNSTAKYPSLNFYIDHKLPAKQTIVFNFTTGWRLEKNNSENQELNPASSLPPAYYNSRTRVGNFDVTAEANYIKEWSTTQLTAGANYYQAWLRTHYLEPLTALTKQRMQNIYMFAEVTQRIKSLTITAGIGAQHLHQTSGSIKENELKWRPRFTASWRANDHNRLSLSFEASSTQPELNQLSDIFTQSNPYFGSIGNPLLKSSMNYTSRLTYNYTHPRVQVQVETNWLRSPQAIMAYYAYNPDYDVITSSYANTSGSRLRFSVSPRVTVIKDWLTCGGRIQLDRYFWHGPDYRNCATGISGNYNAQVTHWNFTLTFQGYFSPKNLTGQQLARNERIQMVFLTYKYRDFNFTAGAFNCYGRHDFFTNINSKDYKSHTVTTIANKPIAIVAVNYNIRWGKQKRQAQRLLDAPSSNSGSSGTLGK